MRKLPFLLFLLLPSLMCAASAKHVQVTVSPSNPSVGSGGTQQFTASVYGTPNTAVTWSATAGTVTSSGLFTAPSVTQSSTVYVKATSAADSRKSATATITVSPATTTQQHTVDLSWIASTSSNVTGYNVYRRSTSSGQYVKINGSLVVSTWYTDSGITSGQTYDYVVTAVDSAGLESAYSNQTQDVVP